MREGGGREGQGTHRHTDTHTHRHTHTQLPLIAHAARNRFSALTTCVTCNKPNAETNNQTSKQKASATTVSCHCMTRCTIMNQRASHLR